MSETAGAAPLPTNSAGPFSSAEPTNVAAGVLSQVQMLRMLAAFLVLASHLVMIDVKYNPLPVMPAWPIIGRSGVDLFFAVSGFIMAAIAGGERRSPMAAGAFLISRAGRVYPLYWAVAAAVTVVWLTRPDLVFSSTPAAPDHLKSFALWPDSRPPLLAVAWTLIHEMYFYLVFAVLLMLPRMLGAPLLFAWGGVVAVGMLQGWGAASPEAAIAVHPLTFEFIAGALAGFAYRRWRGKLGGLALLAGLAAFIGALVWLAVSGVGLGDAFWEQATLRVGLFAVPSALLVYGLASLDLRGIHAPRLARALGDQSYALYLTHLLSLSVAGRVWTMLPQRPETWWASALALLACTLVAYFIAELAYRLIDKPAHRAVQALRRRLSGGRQQQPAAAPESPRESPRGVTFG